MRAACNASVGRRTALADFDNLGINPGRSGVMQLALVGLEDEKMGLALLIKRKPIAIFIER